MLERKPCAATNKKGEPCRAPSTDTGLCFLHSQPGRAAELGRSGGRRNRHFVPREMPPLPALDTVEGVLKAMQVVIHEAYNGNQNAKTMLAFTPPLATMVRILKPSELEERLRKVEAITAPKEPKNEGGSE